MSTAVDGVDVVRKREHAIRRIGRGPLHCHFHHAVFVFSLEVDGLVQRFLALIEEFNEILKTAKRLKHLGTGFAVFAGGALIG